MTTAERAELLAETAANFPEILGTITSEKLLELVHAELGDKEVLDRFCPHGDILSRARAPQRILHIISGNTPHAGLQSLIRGLLLGSLNRIKLPSGGIPELSRFIKSLPKPLSDLVESSKSLSREWQRTADVVVVFGSDETIAKFRAEAHSRQKFIAHGHKVSFGIVFEDRDYSSVKAAANDVAAFNQQGCLSPQCLYVAKSAQLDPREYAERLAKALEELEKTDPRGKISENESAEITNLRIGYRYRAANDPRVAIWESSDSTAWTVIYEDDDQFAISPLNRFIFVKPLPADLTEGLRLAKRHLSSIAVHPHDKENLAALETLGAHRICQLGRSQEPSLFWHHDAGEVLASMVDWIDFG